MKKFFLRSTLVGIVLCDFFVFDYCKVSGEEFKIIDNVEPGSLIALDDIVEGYYAQSNPVINENEFEINGVDIDNHQSSISLQRVLAGNQSQTLVKGKWYEDIQNKETGNRYNTISFLVPTGRVNYHFNYTMAYENGRCTLHRRHVKDNYTGNSTYFNKDGYSGSAGGMETTIEGIDIGLITGGNDNAPTYLNDNQTAKSTINNDDNIDATFNFDTRWSWKAGYGVSTTQTNYVITYHCHVKIWSQHAGVGGDIGQTNVHIKVMVN